MEPRKQDSLGCRRGQNHGRLNGRARHRKHPPNPAWSETLACVDALCRESGDLGFGQWRKTIGPHREDEESKPMMHELEKSDFAIVATKPANKAGQPVRSRWSEGR